MENKLFYTRSDLEWATWTGIAIGCVSCVVIGLALVAFLIW